MQKRSVTLMKRVDSSVETILAQFAKIVELSSILDKSQGTLSVEALQIESNTAGIIRAVEELLSLTRNLKESWILGQIPNQIKNGSGSSSSSKGDDSVRVIAESQEKINAVLGLIISGSRGNEDEVIGEGDGEGMEVIVKYGDEEAQKELKLKEEEKEKEKEKQKESSIEVVPSVIDTASKEEAKEEEEGVKQEPEPEVIQDDDDNDEVMVTDEMMAKEEANKDNEEKAEEVSMAKTDEAQQQAQQQQEEEEEEKKEPDQSADVDLDIKME